MTALHPFRFGVVAPQLRSADEWVAKARRIEALGYATLLIPDTLGMTPTPMPALAVAAAATRTLRVGPYVLANDYRTRSCWPASAPPSTCSRRPVELGHGAGRPNADEDYGKLGIGLDSGGVRVARLAESIGIIKALLAGEQVTCWQALRGDRRGRLSPAGPTAATAPPRGRCRPASARAGGPRGRHRRRRRPPKCSRDGRPGEGRLGARGPARASTRSRSTST